MIAGDWLKPGALVVVEETADVDLQIPAELEEIDRRDQGESRLWFLRKKSI